MQEKDEGGQTVLHWVVVGFISKRAAAWITSAGIGGQVIPLSRVPPMIAVGIPHRGEDTGRWVRGKWCYEPDLQMWNTGEIQVNSNGLNLLWGAKHDESGWWASVDETYVILPDERYDPATGMVGVSSAEPTPLLGEDDVCDDTPF